ncbi:DNA-binding response regulator [Brachybacterium endophyticum]|uniref:DNA-binding response regulator n=1 Tax=Brachybacterium endophyticum TaxID=2182385 RepID=A0A2U2RJS8_9MICO|nr:response regulator transcription factor [Brachybacterium endophyticum]PWH06127.1 DNA-binding response regulator [Brachybacterium endophyticum]
MSTAPFPHSEQDTAPVSVLLVDDEQLMRAGLRMMIDGTDGITVVGEAADGQEAVTASAALDPDVVLMDIRMPGMDGIEATRRLRGTEGHESPGVVMLTAFDTDTFLLDALRAGALSFLLKDSPPDRVVQAVHEAARGESRFSPAVLQRLVGLAAGTAPDGPGSEGAGPALGADTALDADRVIGANTAATGSGEAGPGTPSGPPQGLTDREWEVGRLVAQGLTNSEIADALFLSLPTIKTHIGHLFEKLLITNRVQLAIRVLELETPH